MASFPSTLYFHLFGASFMSIFTFSPASQWSTLICFIAIFNCLLRQKAFKWWKFMNHRGEHFIRIRRKLMQRRRSEGQPSYKSYRLEITIPSKFKDVVEPFMHKDLRVEIKHVGKKMVIEAIPAENII
jgi:hypothetical protein